MNQSLYPSIYEIIDNEIVSGRLGINLNNVVQSIIRGNSIRMNSTTGFSIMGISSSNTTRTLYSNNSVVGDNTSGGVVGSTYANSKAIYFSMSPNDTVYCNTTDTMTWGLEFMGNCLSTNNIAGNIMKRHYDQLTLRTSGAIGPQTERVFPLLAGTKLMANEFTTLSALHANTCTYSSFGGSYVFKTNPSSPYYPPTNLAIGIGSSFIPAPFMTPNYKCDPYISSGSGGGSGLWSGEDSTGMENMKLAEEIVNETITSEFFDDAYKLGLKKELYSDLNIDSTLKDSSAIVDGFFNAAKGSNIGKLFDIQSDLKNELIIDAAIKNNNIVPNNNLEANEKMLNDIILQLPQTGFAEEIIESISSIANQCPISGGKSVFICRSLISSLDMNAYWDDDDRCIQGMDFRRGTSMQNLEAVQFRKCSVYPNPANDILFLFNDDFSKLSKYLIRDALGSIVIQSNQLDMELTKIDISNIIEGFYVLELYGSTKKEVFKFNIIRSK